jgi:hypothetical protein
MVMVMVMVMVMEEVVMCYVISALVENMAAVEGVEGMDGMGLG